MRNQRGSRREFHCSDRPSNLRARKKQNKAWEESIENQKGAKGLEGTFAGLSLCANQMGPARRGGNVSGGGSGSGKGFGRIAMTGRIGAWYNEEIH